jgi:hypothetical protein
MELSGLIICGLIDTWYASTASWFPHRGMRYWTTLVNSKMRYEDCVLKRRWDGVGVQQMSFVSPRDADASLHILIGFH